MDTTIELSKEQLVQIKQIELDILIEVDRLCKKYSISYTLGYGTLIGAIRHDGFIPWDDDIDICIPRKDYLRFREICHDELDGKFFYQSQDTEQDYYCLFDKIRAKNTIFKEYVLKDYNINHGVYIDIFPVDNIPNSKKKRKLQYLEYRFLRACLNSRYYTIDFRSGKKKLAAYVLRFISEPVSNQFLYNRAEEVAMRYMNSNCDYVGCFMSAYGEECFPKEFFYETTEHQFEGYVFNVPSHYNDILKAIYGDYMVLPPEHDRYAKHFLVELKL